MGGMKTCAVADCPKPSRAKGLCPTHYAREYRHGTTDLTPRAPRPPQTCSVPDCDSPVKASKLCSRHYTRLYETGSLGLGVRPRGNHRRVEPLEDRFWAKVKKTADCWLWTGGKTTLGYGSIWSGPDGRPLMAHRVSWEIANGTPMPDGLHIDHLCRVPSCVNPAHLEPVSVSENTRRGYAPSIRAAQQLAKTHCPHGHPYSDGNTYMSKRGSRACRTCRREQQRARRARKKGTPHVDESVSPSPE